MKASDAAKLVESTGRKVIAPPEIYPILDELGEKLPKELIPEVFDLMAKRDGATPLARRLSKILPLGKVIEGTNEHRAWELTGLFYLKQQRFHEALPIFFSMYEQMLEGQEKTGKRNHKGTPLCWISDCYAGMNYQVLSKRYLMLTLCEDSVTTGGVIDPNKTGVYFRLVWYHGLTDEEVQRYAKRIRELAMSNPNDNLFPEGILQELDREWMVEFPALDEALVYAANKRYIRHLIATLGEPTGRQLELLADYLLACMPGCRTNRRQKSKSTDYDIICSIEGLETDFRSELGRYFVCECKDWASAADFTTFSKFCRVLDSTKSRFGILFSKNGLSGQGKTTDAEREQLKVFQDRGMVIVVVDEADIERVASGANFINMLRAKYERIRLDLIG